MTAQHTFAALEMNPVMDSDRGYVATFRYWFFHCPGKLSASCADSETEKALMFLTYANKLYAAERRAGTLKMPKIELTPNQRDIRRHAFLGAVSQGSDPEDCPYLIALWDEVHSGIIEV